MPCGLYGMKNAKTGTENQRGAAAIEFAILMVLFFVPFFLGLTEACEAFTVSKRVSHATGTLAEVISRLPEDVTPDDAQALIEAISRILDPDHNVNDPDVEATIICITPDEGGDGDPVLTVEWSIDQNGEQPYTGRQDENTPGEIYENLLPDIMTLVVGDDVFEAPSMIVVELEYTYSMRMPLLFFEPRLTFDRLAIRFPRTADVIGLDQ